MSRLKGSITRGTVHTRLTKLREQLEPGSEGSVIVWAAGILSEGGFIPNPEHYVFSEHDPDGPAHIKGLTHHALLLYRGTTKAALAEIVEFITARLHECKDLLLAEESLCFDSSAAKVEESCAASSTEGWGTW